MLEIRLNCEHCDQELKPDSTDAMMCSFECTFCKNCVESLLNNVCPNCGGGFYQRPVRPAKNWKGDNYLGAYPPTQRRFFKPVNSAQHQKFSAEISLIKPEKR